MSAATKAVVVLVEGPGDAYYVMRCLGQHVGADYDKRKPVDYETPFGSKTPKHPGFVIRWNTRAEAQELRLAESAEGDQPVFQSVALAGDMLYLIVRMGGDGQRSRAKITEVQRLAYSLVESMSDHPTEIKKIALAFLYDADRPSHYNKAKGTDCVQERAATFAADFAPRASFASRITNPNAPPTQYSLLNANVGGPTHASWVQGTHFPVGLFVLHNPNTLQGTLEDLIEPALRGDAVWDDHIEPELRGDAVWKDRLNKAEDYLTRLEAPGDDIKDSPSERAKARLTIAGQFNHAGESLGQLIRKGARPAMPDSVFNTKVSKELASFLTKAPWT